MTFIKNRWADIAGYRTPNGTVVDSFVRTDPTGPVWKVRCSCGELFFLPHSRIAPILQTSAPLYCGKCVLPSVKPETLADRRREEREEQRQADVAAQKERDRVAQEAANEAALRAEKSRYLRFANAQIRANVMPGDAEFMTFERWLKCSEHWRQEVLQQIGG